MKYENGSQMEINVLIKTCCKRDESECNDSIWKRKSRVPERDQPEQETLRDRNHKNRSMFIFPSLSLSLARICRNSLLPV